MFLYLKYKLIFIQPRLYFMHTNGLADYYDSGKMTESFAGFIKERTSIYFSRSSLL